MCLRLTKQEMEMSMKTENNILGIATALLIMLQGCGMEEGKGFRGYVEEGVPVRVSLDYASEENIAVTRAAQTAEYENRIENLYIFVFNSAGQRQPLLVNTAGEERTDNVFRFNGGLNPDDGNLSLGSGSVDFVCGSLNDATIVAIANVKDGNTNTAYSVTPEVLDAISTLPRLREEIMTMNVAAVNRGALFMMTGYAEDENGGNKVTITGTEDGSGSVQCTLKLRRTDAKIQVNVQAEAGESSWTDFSFVPEKWRVCQVPRQSLILPDTSPKDADGEYFSTNYYDFETNVDGVYGFIFYMPENLKTPKKTIIGDEYALREKWITESFNDPAKPGQNERNTSFEYANDNSTYLEITGRLSYKQKGAPVEATTRYYVHLGYADNDPNDYLTRRNYHYTYKITVKGVKNIVLDVRSGQDNRPGQEGDVIESMNEVYELDSHYDRCLLKINPDHIVDKCETQTTWSVSTPFCTGGVYDPSTGSTEGIEDYRWIKFAINKLHGAEYGKFVKYPGDGEYKMNFIPDESTAADDLPGLLDIHQLITYLKILKKSAPDMSAIIADNTTDGLICITAFVDEYVYVDDPRTEVEEYDLSMWKDFVNVADREMHILSEGRSYSSDGNSSYIPSIYSFRQKSIRTMYNPEVAETAWGLESVMETGRLEPGPIPSTASDLQNGRSNMLKWIPNATLKWEDVLSTSDAYELEDGYDNALYACLMRNRDLDGDGDIDHNEIRWYLASINQLTDMYIGEYAIDRDSRLYPWNPGENPNDLPGGNGVYWHYTSSSYNTNPNQNGPWVLWAEEGASKGNYSSSMRDDSNGKYYSYRCVRNLGIDITDIATFPEDFVEWSENGDGTYIFDLSRLDPQALRDYSVEGSGTYPKHDDKDRDNLPYSRFVVSGKLYPEPVCESGWSGEWNTNDWDYFQTNNPCKNDNYRVPTMRELLIFMSRIGETLRDEWLDMYYHEGGWFEPNQEFFYPHLHSFTNFSMRNIPPYANQGRKGYSYNSDDGSMGPGVDNMGYTCGVRDDIQ